MKKYLLILVLALTSNVVVAGNITSINLSNPHNLNVRIKHNDTIIHAHTVHNRPFTEGDTIDVLINNKPVASKRLTEKAHNNKTILIYIDQAKNKDKGTQARIEP